MLLIRTATPVKTIEQDSWCARRLGVSGSSSPRGWVRLHALAFLLPSAVRVARICLPRLQAPSSLFSDWRRRTERASQLQGWIQTAQRSWIRSVRGQGLLPQSRSFDNGRPRRREDRASLIEVSEELRQRRSRRALQSRSRSTLNS
jgi:hypothetical protein